MILLPKEHGAYGQVAFPILTALAVAGLSAPAVMIAAVTIAVFLAHEPAVVMFGHRGARAKRELGRTASRWLAAWIGVALVAGTGVLLTTAPEARWSLLVPLGPAAVVATAMIRGTEKSWYGEVASAVAFCSVTVPMAITGGYSPAAASAIAIPFIVVFVTSTLAVRVVILRVRGGGNSEAAAATRRAAFGLAGCATAALLWAVAATMLPLSVFVAAAPGLVIAVIIAARPPAPARLTTLGWTLVVASLLTALTTITAASL